MSIDEKTLTEMALATEPLQIPSATHRREVLKAVSRAQLPHLDELTRQQIEREINAGVNPEDTARKTERDSSMPPGPGEADDAPKIPKTPQVPRHVK